MTKLLKRGIVAELYPKFLRVKTIGFDWTKLYSSTTVTLIQGNFYLCFFCPKVPEHQMLVLVTIVSRLHRTDFMRLSQVEVQSQHRHWLIGFLTSWVSWNEFADGSGPLCRGSIRILHANSRFALGRGRWVNMPEPLESSQAGCLRKMHLLGKTNALCNRRCDQNERSFVYLVCSE